MTAIEMLSTAATEAAASVVHTGTAPAGCSVGVDATSVAEVGEAIHAHGDRYLERVFTEAERAGLGDCSSADAAQSLAARFAAKEAVLKLLEPGAGTARPEWRSIEIVRRTSGACGVVLHGAALRLAEARRIAEISLSMSHDGDLAIAVAIAVVAVDAGKETRGV